MKPLNSLKSETAFPHSSVPINGCYSSSQRMFSSNVSETKAYSGLLQGLRSVRTSRNKKSNLIYTLTFLVLQANPFHQVNKEAGC